LVRILQRTKPRVVYFLKVHINAVTSNH
jgi:hypothetical protein